MLFAALTEHRTQKVSRELKDKRPINSKDSEVWIEMCCPVSESWGFVEGAAICCLEKRPFKPKYLLTGADLSLTVTEILWLHWPQNITKT